MQVGHVVSGPGGQQLRERYRAESRMAPPLGHLLGLQIQRPQIIETPRPYHSEFIEQLRQALALGFFYVPQPIEWIKRLRFAELQNLSGAR